VSAALLMQQVRLEQRSFWRNPESAFFNFAMPPGVLLIVGAMSIGESVPGRTDIKALTLFVPGLLAFAVVVTAYGNVAATLALLRTSGVLKRMRATPLSPRVYIGGQLLSTLGTASLISLVTIGLGAAAFRVTPLAVATPQLALVLVLGIICFAALGVAISAAIPTADAAGAITNGTYLPLAMVSGVFSSQIHLPGWLDPIISALPIKAMADGLRSAYDPMHHGFPTVEVAVLALWAIAGVALATRYFRWES
jgi:ABC-2 type transport system permease protein